MIEYTGLFTLCILLHFCNQGPVYAEYTRNRPYSGYSATLITNMKEYTGPVYSIHFRSENTLPNPPHPTNTKGKI